MKISSNIVATVGCVLTLALQACRSDNPINPGAISVNKVYGLEITDTTSVIIRGVGQDSMETGYIDRRNVVWASLCNGSRRGVDGGSVVFSTDTLDKRTDSNGTVYGQWLSTTGLAFPNFNGSPIYFRVTGSLVFDPLLIDVNTPNGKTRILSPSLMDSVSNSGSIPISWTSSGAADTALITIGAIGDTNSSSFAALSYVVPDNGSYTVSSSDAATLPSGQYQLTVARVNWNSDTTGGRAVYAIIPSEQSKTIVVY